MLGSFPANSFYSIIVNNCPSDFFGPCNKAVDIRKKFIEECEKYIQEHCASYYSPCSYIFLPSSKNIYDFSPSICGYVKEIKNNIFASTIKIPDKFCYVE